MRHSPFPGRQSPSWHAHAKLGRHSGTRGREISELLRQDSDLRSGMKKPVVTHRLYSVLQDFLSTVKGWKYIYETAFPSVSRLRGGQDSSTIHVGSVCGPYSLSPPIHKFGHALPASVGQARCLSHQRKRATAPGTKSYFNRIDGRAGCASGRGKDGGSFPSYCHQAGRSGAVSSSPVRSTPYPPSASTRSLKRRPRITSRRI